MQVDTIIAIVGACIAGIVGTNQYHRRRNGSVVPGTGSLCIEHVEKIAGLRSDVKAIRASVGRIERGLDELRKIKGD